MDDDTRQKITEELTEYLNRPPSENEIGNGVTDINIMAKVRQRQNDEKQKIVTSQIESIQAKVEPVILKEQ